MSDCNEKEREKNAVVLLFSQIGTLLNLSFLLTVHSTVHVFAAVGCWNGLACTAVELASMAYAFRHLPVVRTDSDNRDEVRFLFAIVACGGDIQPFHPYPRVGRHFNQSRSSFFFKGLLLFFSLSPYSLERERDSLGIEFDPVIACSPFLSRSCSGSMFLAVLPWRQSQ